MRWEEIITDLLEIDKRVKQLLIPVDEVPVLPIFKFDWLDALPETKIECSNLIIKSFEIRFVNVGNDVYLLLVPHCFSIDTILVRRDRIDVCYDNKTITLCPSSPNTEDRLYFYLLFPYVWKTIKQKLEDIVEHLKEAKTTVNNLFEGLKKVSQMLQGIQNTLR